MKRITVPKIARRYSMTDKPSDVLRKKALSHIFLPSVNDWLVFAFSPSPGVRNRRIDRE
jgi:hypothetical protein